MIYDMCLTVQMITILFPYTLLLFNISAENSNIYAWTHFIFGFNNVFKETIIVKQYILNSMLLNLHVIAHSINKIKNYNTSFQ